jgi:pimeloyl-ACP methyl ester carboxylesterase
MRFLEIVDQGVLRPRGAGHSRVEVRALCHLPTRTGSIYYEVHGQGEPLLLIMGTGTDHRLWNAQLPGLANEFSLHRVRQPWNG